MDWIELVGSPAAGKSTLVDKFWPPDAIKYDKSLPPKEWKPFLDYCDTCIKLMEKHPRFRVGKSLIERSIRKMTTVYNMQNNLIYIQTGFMQRSLGIYTRVDKNIREEVVTKYLNLCPVPLGVVTLYADIETIKYRNRTRNKQNRDFMVEETEECMEIVRRVVEARKIPHWPLDTRDSIVHNQNHINHFKLALRDRHGKRKLP